MAQPYVIDLKGEKEPFSREKVYQSARRAGASLEMARRIANDIEKGIYSGITTAEIFKRVQDMLQEHTPRAAMVFNLKEGMRKLGPTGFPFEKYIGEILTGRGFSVKLNQFIPGFCISAYEIDFLAQKDNLLYVGECKYRNQPGGRIHLDDALMNYARFLDIEKGGFLNKHFKGMRLQSMLVTNTKFTSEAIKYSQCSGVGLLGWRYPEKEGLEQVIDSQKLYPITVLRSLNSYMAEALAGEHIMMVRDLLRIDADKFAKKTRIPRQKLVQLIEEAGILLEEHA